MKLQLLLFFPCFNADLEASSKFWLSVFTTEHSEILPHPIPSCKNIGIFLEKRDYLINSAAALQVVPLDPPFIFNSKIGELRVTIRKGLYILSAPIPKIIPLVKPENLEGVFKSLPIDSFKAGKDIYFVFDTFKEIINYKLDITKISNLSKNGVGITARYSDEFDIISRFFVPNEGIAEDPVTGSAHAALGVYWSRAIGKNKLKAYQASERGGVIWLEVTDNRINIIGNAITYMKAEIRITHVD